MLAPIIFVILFVCAFLAYLSYCDKKAGELLVEVLKQAGFEERDGRHQEIMRKMFAGTCDPILITENDRWEVVAFRTSRLVNPGHTQWEETRLIFAFFDHNRNFPTFYLRPAWQVRLNNPIFKMVILPAVVSDCHVEASEESTEQVKHLLVSAKPHVVLFQRFGRYWALHGFGPSLIVSIYFPKMKKIAGFFETSRLVADSIRNVEQKPTQPAAAESLSPASASPRKTSDIR
jgi:hypothetical protein